MLSFPLYLVSSTNQLFITVFWFKFVRHNSDDLQYKHFDDHSKPEIAHVFAHYVTSQKNDLSFPLTYRVLKQ